jgi:hypothetical protein
VGELDSFDREGARGGNVRRILHGVCGRRAREGGEHERREPKTNE